MHHNLCKNCEHTFEGNFCSNCGQKTNTVRLNWHFIKEELQYTFLHVNKGFLYSIKELLTRPGDTVREFLEGKRIKHYKPILLVFILAGLSGFLSLYIEMDYSQMVAEKNEITDQIPKIIHWLFGHYALFELTLIPLLSIWSWLSFKKYGYNYIENIIINCFASAQRLIIGIAAAPILLLVDSKYTMIVATYLSIPIYLATIWLYLQLYKKHAIGDVIVRLLLFGFLAMITFFIVLILGLFCYIYYLSKTGQIHIN